MARKALLTNESAIEYVRGYYASHEYVRLVQIEQAAFIKAFGDTPDLVTVIAKTEFQDRPETIQWDVWLEDDGEGGLCLYGEF